MKINNSRLRTLTEVAIVSVILIILGAYTWNYYDIAVFMDWVRIAITTSPLCIYIYAVKCGYMPLAPLTFIAFAIASYNVLMLIYNLVPPEVQLYIFRLMIKLPLFISIYLVGYILHKREGWKIAREWLIGIPVFIIISTYQFDPLMVLTLLLGAYALIDRKYKLAGVYWALSTAIKYIPAILIPIIAKDLKRKGKLKEFFVPYLIVLATITLPFMIMDPTAFIKNALGFHMFRPPQMLSIFNVPYLISRFDPIVGITLAQIWAPIVITIYAIMIKYLDVDTLSKDELFKALFIVIGVFLLVNKVVNPGYIMWVYPFLIYWLNKLNNKKLKMLVLASILIAITVISLRYYVCAELGKPIYIEEDMAWYDSKSFVEKSVSVYDELEENINIDQDLLRWFYENYPLIGALSITAYNISFLYLIAKVWKRKNP